MKSNRINLQGDARLFDRISDCSKQTFSSEYPRTAAVLETVC